MQSKKSKWMSLQWDKYMVYIIFAVVFVLFAIILGQKGFLSSNNLLNILRQTAMISVMAVSATFVMAAGQIDLTVGSIAAMTAMFVSLVLQSTNNIFLALLIGIGFGCIVGCVNGLLVTKLGLPAFLATMGMMQVVRGSAMWITDTAAVPIENIGFNTVFGIGTVGGLSVLILWTILFYIIGIILFNKTAFGRHTLATGGNEMAATYSGVNTVKIKVIAFAMSGAFAAFAGIMYAARMQAGRYSYGEGDEMSVIAAVVLGGTSMSGGTGSVIGALFGSILMGMINNALILANLSSAQQTVVKGCIIIFAVAISNIAQKLKKNAGK
jgi:ribose transport system permease protein